MKVGQTHKFDRLEVIFWHKLTSQCRKALEPSSCEISHLKHLQLWCRMIVQQKQSPIICLLLPGAKIMNKILSLDITLFSLEFIDQNLNAECKNICRFFADFFFSNTLLKVAFLEKSSVWLVQVQKNFTENFYYPQTGCNTSCKQYTWWLDVTFDNLNKGFNQGISGKGSWNFAYIKLKYILIKM